MKEPSAARLIFSVSLTALLAGLCLSGVYEVTAPRIAANQAEATRQAIFLVLPGTTRFEKQTQGIYRGFNAEGQQTGLAISGSGVGFGGRLELLFGFRTDTRRIIGLSILSSLETPGLGDKIETDAAFTASFRNLKVDPIIECMAKPTQANQVDSISGATISSKAVVHIINQRLAGMEDIP